MTDDNWFFSSSFEDYKLIILRNRYIELDIQELVNNIKTHLFDEKIEELP